MNFITGIAKLAIIIFYLCLLLLASNQHGKSLKCNVNFWVVLGVIVVNIVVMSVGGFFDGFLNIGT